MNEIKDKFAICKLFGEEFRIVITVDELDCAVNSLLDKEYEPTVEELYEVVRELIMEQINDNIEIEVESAIEEYLEETEDVQVNENV